MYICVCGAVTDTIIRQAIQEGAKTLVEVQLCTGACLQCGQCQPLVQALLDEEAQKEKSK